LTDWKEKTLACWETINSMAARRFGEGVLAEEAALAVIEGLRADNWHRVRAYDERASFATFVRTLTARLLEDFARKRFGRLRPPFWITSFGGIWVKLFTALCLERLPLGSAVEVVLQRQMTAKKSEIEAAACQLLERIPDCGMHQGLEVSFNEEENVTDDRPDGPLGPDHAAEEQQKRELFEAIFQLILGETEFRVADALLVKLNRLAIQLSPEEKLLIKLCYQDGLGVAQAGDMLGLNRFQVHGKKRRLLARLKQEFDRTGLAEDLRPLLDV